MVLAQFSRDNLQQQHLKKGNLNDLNPNGPVKTMALLKRKLSSRRFIWLVWSPSLVQFGSVTQSCPTLCDLMNRSTSGLPVHHKLPEFTQTHVHRVGDAIQPSHPLLSPSPPAPNPSQHQGLFQ